MGERVLVVDQDRDIARYIELNFSLEKFEVRVAHSGKGALEEARAFQPDVVVMEAVLDDIDGYEVARQLKTDPATEAIGILMLSMKSLSADVVLGLTAGADDYVAKPFDPPELVARVRALARRRNKERLPGGRLSPSESAAATVASIPAASDAAQQTISSLDARSVDALLEAARALISTVGTEEPSEELVRRLHQLRERHDGGLAAVEAMAEIATPAPPKVLQLFINIPAIASVTEPTSAPSRTAAGGWAAATLLWMSSALAGAWIGAGIASGQLVDVIGGLYTTLLGFVALADRE